MSTYPKKILRTGKVLEGSLDVALEGLVVEIIGCPARDAPKTELFCKLHVLIE